MKKYISLTIVAIFVWGCASTAKVPENVTLQTLKDSVSYSLGNDVGNTFKSRGMEYEPQSFYEGFVETYKKDTSYVYGASLAANFLLQGIDVNPQVFFNSFQNTTAGDSLLLQVGDMKKIVQDYNQQLRDEAAQKAKIKAEENSLNGELFLKEYLSINESAVVLESGLVYRVLSEGFGEVPTDKDRVVVHYTGKLIDGTVFDSSVERGEPAKFAVGSVIVGWQEALQLMPAGSKWELIIPAELAYGDRASGSIPGNSTLIFEVELLGIE